MLNCAFCVTIPIVCVRTCVYRCFLECLLVILTHPAIGRQPDMFAAVADILMELMTFPAGMVLGGILYEYIGFGGMSEQ